MADRAFLFHETTNNFRAFQFSGTAETSDNWSPGFNTIGGATADATRIVVLDTSPATPVARFFNASRVRQATSDITMNSSSDTYAGVALTDTHLVAINQSQDTLEFYDLTTKVYAASMDKEITGTANSILRAICRGGDNLFVVMGGDSDADRKIFKRNLDGSADTVTGSWALPSGTNHDTIYATLDRVVAVRRATGHGDQFEFDGTADTIIGPFGSGTWAGSYTTFEPPPAPPAISAVASPLDIVVDTPYCLTVTITGNPTEVTVKGDLERLSYNWDKVKTLKIMGTPKRLLRNKTLTIKAVYTGNPTLTKDVIYNVVPAAPIISDPGRLTFYRGLNYDDNPIKISIANNPTVVNLRGLQLGLGQKKQDPGALITGMIPVDAEFTVDTGTIDMLAANAGGEHRLPVQFDISDDNVWMANFKYTASSKRLELTIQDVEGNALPSNISIRASGQNVSGTGVSYTIAWTLSHRSNNNFNNGYILSGTILDSGGAHLPARDGFFARARATNGNYTQRVKEFSYNNGFSVTEQRRTTINSSHPLIFDHPYRNSNVSVQQFGNIAGEFSISSTGSGTNTDSLIVPASISVPTSTYGTGYSQTISYVGTNVRANLVFSFRVNGRNIQLRLSNFDVADDRTESLTFAAPDS